MRLVELFFDFQRTANGELAASMETEKNQPSYRIGTDACQKNKTVNSVQIKLKIFLLESDTGHAVNFFRITVFA